MRKALVLAGALAAACPATARAELVTFDVDPARSQIAMAGSTSGSTLQEQSPGSLSARFSGTILAEVTEGEIRFPGGGAVRGVQTQEYQPAPGGGPGSALAAYGAKATLTVVIFTVTASAAARDVLFDLESPALARAGSSFDARGVRFRIPESGNTKLDYRTSGALTLTGSSPVVGLATNRAPAGLLAPVEGVDTLTVPFDAVFFFDLINPGDTELKFNGQIVATRRSGPTTPPVINFTLPAPGNPTFTLSWPAGFKLQHATQLTPPDWKDLPVTSPFTVPTLLPGEYFQVVSAP